MPKGLFLSKNGGMNETKNAHALGLLREHINPCQNNILRVTCVGFWTRAFVLVRHMV